MFELTEVMKAVGPNASIVFAAWIFLSFLQSRYTAAYERYRALVDAYRAGDMGLRRDHIAVEIRLYKKRCIQMKVATNIGVSSAMLLITSLIVAALDVIFPMMLWRYVGTACALVGLAMVVVAAAFVLIENSSIQASLDNELADIPDL